MQGRGIDASLNETGRRQATALADYLQHIKIDYIFSSSLKRSRETAEIIAEIWGLDFYSYPELDEMNFGVLEGQPVADIKPELNQLRDNWRQGNVKFALENGESPFSVYERVSQRMEWVLKEYAPANLMFVLHGRLIRILLSEWLEYGLHSMHRIEHANGALYHLEWNGTIFNPVRVNFTDHLIELK